MLDKNMDVKVTDHDNQSSLILNLISIHFFHFSSNYVISVNFHQASHPSIFQFQHYTLFFLKSLSFQDDPYVFQKIDENGVVTYEGFCIDLLNEISNHLGFKYEIRVSPKNEYGNCNDEGVCNGMVKELVEKVTTSCGVSL